MNYKSQLRGWAVDRIIEMWRATSSTAGTLADLKAQAIELMEFAYVAAEDLESSSRDLYELIKEAPAHQSNIDNIIAVLENLRDERRRQGLEKSNENETVN